MRIPVSCGSCSNEFSASENSVGKRIKCPVCGEGVRVLATADDEPELPRRSTGSKKNKGRKDNSGGSSTMLIGLAVGGGGIAVLGLVLFLMFGRGGNLSAPPANSPSTAATPSPPTIPEAPGGNSPVLERPPMITDQPNPPTLGNGISVPMPTPSIPPGSNPAGAEAATHVPKEAATPSDDEPLRELSMPELVAKVERSVVRIIVKSEQGASVGSGFVIDSDGSIMTNYHVIEGAQSAEVEFETGKKVTVIGFTTVDKERDLAIIKIEQDPSLLYRMRVAGELPKKGEKVAAFGAPRGLSFTASDGIISAIRHTPEFNARTAGSYLQTTTPISPGNSGGPLVNMRGEVVGVNSFKVEGENLNFAASATDIRDVIANRGTMVTPLSPSALPLKYTEKFGRAENLAGTTRGNVLLGQINDVIIMMLPFTFDPSGRVSDNVETQVEKNLIKKAGWTKVTRQSQVKGSTALVVVLIYFQAAEKIPDAEKKGVSELMCRVRIVARDVDKDGVAYAAIVWDENSALGTISLNSLLGGGFPNAMKGKISEFFNKIFVGIKKAQRNTDGGG